MTEHVFGAGRLRLERGDITKTAADAIVNAANASLLGGGGVDGAIHRAGGPSILKECRSIRAERGGCPTGEAVATTAGRLAARYVIHTVGPVWNGGDRDEDALLDSCYRRSLALAGELDCRTIAFPSISTGAFGFHPDRAARIAIPAVRAGLEDRLVEQATFVLFSDSDLETYRGALREIAGS